MGLRSPNQSGQPCEERSHETSRRAPRCALSQLLSARGASRQQLSGLHGQVDSDGANTRADRLGALAAALGAKRRSRFAIMTGVLGAGVGAYYITRVTAPHDGLERAFGPDWKQRIPPDAERRMLQRRRSMRLPRVPEPRWTRDVPFWTIPGTDRQLLADIWEPAAGVERTGTAIVYLYGGSWHFFDKDVLTRPLFRQLAAQGHVVMDAAHRSCPETDVIGMVGDVHRAVAWIKANAERYGIDPERVVVMGGSSGAHIALLAAYAPDEPNLVPGELQGADTSVMAVVSWYGIPEMASAVERWLGQRLHPHRLRCGIARNPARSPTSSTP